MKNDYEKVLDEKIQFFFTSFPSNDLERFDKDGLVVLIGQGNVIFILM